MTKKDFARRFTGLRPGQGLIYHIGFLMADRTVDKAVDAVGKAAWVLYKNGEATLVCRPLHDSPGYEYMAVKL
jgi:hypothetical protein